ncbi:MAG: molybdopterin-dependent oxidoreductase [Pseudomonadota bacterium]
MTIQMNPTVGADGEHATFCRFCEAQCGLVATVRAGRVIKIAPDRDNPHSQGHVCVKGIAAAEVTYDPDRVTTPLKRVGAAGEFVAVGWDEALEDIARRLKAIRGEHGGDAIATYLGNPSAYASEALPALLCLTEALGSTKKYGAGTQDTTARQLANYIAYGAIGPFAMPDLPSCDFLLMLGANPMISNGSLMFAPRIRHDLDDIASRGRVIVVDPRRSETAQRYEHLPILPNGDVWLLLAMLRVLIEEQLIDAAMAGRDVAGWDQLGKHVMAQSMADCVGRCAIPEDTIRQLTRDFMRARRAAIYGRVGIGRGPHATLTNLLLTALNALSGGYGIEGGTVFGRQVFPARKAKRGGYTTLHSRLGAIPSVGGYMPGAMMADDILQPGPGRVHALLVTHGNPLLSAPGGARLEEALRSLDLLVSFDLYVNETNRHAHYILPGTTFLERADLPLFGLMFLIRPFLQFSDAVVPPVGQARNEFDTLVELFRRMGMGAPSASPLQRALGWLGLNPSPLTLFDIAIRLGPVGDRFGLRQGWSLKRLRRHPHGVMVDAPHSQPTWKTRLAHADGKIHVWHPMLEGEFARLRGAAPTPGQFHLLSIRNIRSLNSWMHNIDRLVRSQHPALLMHPLDAAQLGVVKGDMVRISSAADSLTLPVTLSDEVIRGALCYPHGWGHQGGWLTANAHTGENVNRLLGLGTEAAERISGTTLIDGLAVTVAKATTTAGDSPQAGVRVPVAQD